MRAGLVRQALRKQPWSFAGPFITQCLAAALVTGALGAASSLPAGSDLAAFAGVLVGLAVYLSAIIVGVTMSSTIARQARDIALVRAVGAAPGQVRRAAAGQAAVVAVPATLAGVPLGTVGGSAWVDSLVTHDVVSATVTFEAHPAAFPIALAITLGTSVVGALIAAIRPSRVRPAVALTDTAAPRRQLGPIRTLLGLLFVAGGVAGSIVISGLDADAAEQSAFFVLLAMCVGAGLLAPALLRVTAPLALLLGPIGRLAADNLAARARSYSGALVPLVLAAAFALIKIAAHTTAEHVTGRPQPASDVWLDYSGTAVYTVFAAVAALTTLITVVLGRRRELALLRLAGATRASALGVVVCEALIVTVTGLLVAAGAAAATLLPMLPTAPYVPSGVVVAGVLGTALVVGAGMVAPALGVMRRPAIASVGDGS
ncbi:FtsX-like permease family protein [Cryptosporangium aurantiacum]|uniref:Putative ABC transport system permease protein n=1 Tax=Cryptosporangium aurantiacum TaxID=134849 RepID=A0A1M7QM00_9ACTN|nr:FtsX-like permease family protein [Cryptosporangium aurantiacum]SHN32190.1 putative ABC transport system permease protein [Cryptosporangium aurantiacum]